MMVLAPVGGDALLDRLGGVKVEVLSWNETFNQAVTATAPHANHRELDAAGFGRTYRGKEPEWRHAVTLHPGRLVAARTLGEVQLADLGW
jgi:hypothetical protein